MRIIGGTLSGRRLEGSPGSLTRPTSARAREGLASALQARAAFEDSHVLELFAGTGAFSFEAISRGAQSALCIDKSSACARTIRENAEVLGVADQVRCEVADLFGARAIERVAVPKGGFGLVFADPPYEFAASIAKVILALADEGGFAEGAWIAMEHPQGCPPPEIVGLALEADYRYGDSAIRLGRFSMDVK